MKKHRQILAAFASSLVLASGFALTATTSAVAQEEEERRPRQSATLDPAVGRVIAPIFENEIANEQWDACIAKITQLINERGSRFKPYDTAIVNQLLGQCQAGKEDFRSALRSFQRAVDSGGLPPDQVNGLRYAIAQLNFAVEDYNAAIRGLNAWINGGGTPDANAYYLLGAAYTQISPPNFNSARRPAEQAIALREEPKKSDHDLLNLIYSELSANGPRGQLLEKMINLWPDQRTYWTQLSGLYNQTGRDKDAFAVLEVAYRAGLLDKESDILTLVQYYSYFDNPYRGAKMMEREMNAGVVQRNTKNLTLLSQLWSQSREHKRAIPILEEAAGRSDDGKLFYRLGQVLIADEQYAKGEQALARARQKGGLTAKQVGDSWMLTGTARFSRAGQGDVAARNRAREAFQNATRYESSARQARDWVAYINAINETERAQDVLACNQAEDERRASIDRSRQQLQVCKLQGGSEGSCSPIEDQLKSLLETTPPECVKVRGSGGDDDGGEASASTESSQDSGDASLSTDEAASTEETPDVGVTPDGGETGLEQDGGTQ